MAAANGNACPRCGGSGRIERFRHVRDGVCFTCWGSGIAPPTHPDVDAPRPPKPRLVPPGTAMDLSQWLDREIDRDGGAAVPARPPRARVVRFLCERPADGTMLYECAVELPAGCPEVRFPAHIPHYWDRSLGAAGEVMLADPFGLPYNLFIVPDEALPTAAALSAARARSQLDLALRLAASLGALRQDDENPAEEASDASAGAPARA